MLYRGRRGASFVPLYSMSDLAFLLLIFIMLVSLIHYRPHIHIQHALAETAIGVGAERNLEIWVDRTGGFFLAGQAVSLADIEYSAAEISRQAPDTRVHIIADRYTPFENVHKALEIFQRLEYPQVSFVVRAEVPQ